MVVLKLMVVQGFSQLCGLMQLFMWSVPLEVKVLLQGAWLCFGSRRGAALSLG